MQAGGESSHLLPVLQSEQRSSEEESIMSVHKEERHYEVVVVGGGMAGVCAAIASARKGVRTAIVQNRSMFGGNASSEIRMHIVGANAHGSKKNLGETGILLEILLENKRRNPYASFPVFDSVIWEKVHFQENLDAYLNTDMDDVIMDGKKVLSAIRTPQRQNLQSMVISSWMPRDMARWRPWEALPEGWAAKDAMNSMSRMRRRNRIRIRWAIH